MAKFLSDIFKCVVSIIKFVCVIVMALFLGLFMIFGIVYHIYSSIITLLLYVGVDARKRRMPEEPGGSGYCDGFNLVGWGAIILMLFAIVTGVLGMINQVLGH